MKKFKFTHQTFKDLICLLIVVGLFLFQYWDAGFNELKTLFLLVLISLFSMKSRAEKDFNRKSNLNQQWEKEQTSQDEEEHQDL